MISYKSFLILAAVVVLLGLVLEGTATPANLHRRQKSPPKTVVKTANGNGNSPKKTVAPQPPSPPPPPPVVKTTRSNKAEETTSPAPVPATTSPKTPEETPVFALPQQKFAEWVPRGLGDARSGANFPKNDKDGRKREKRAKALRQDWHKEKPGQGNAPRAISVARWDLTNVGGVNYLTSIRDQGSCGSCVAFSTVAALEASINYRSGSTSASLTALPDLSEHWLYYCLGARTCNAGWWIDTGVLTAARGGAVVESCMPYSTSTTRCYTATCNTVTANVNKTTGSIEAAALNSLDAIRQHIVDFGPISTGFTVYSDFPGFQDSSVYSFGDSYVWPGTKTNVILGGHAVMCHGFDDDMLNGVTPTSKGVLFCKNSWGTSWGNRGFFKIAYFADGIGSGYGDSYGFRFTPFPTAIKTTAAPPAVEPTGPAPEPVPTTVAPPSVPTTARPIVPTTAKPMATTKRPSTPKPPKATKTKAPKLPKTTRAPSKANRKMSAYACENRAGSARVLKFGCQRFEGTYMNITGVVYGRDVAGVRGRASTCPRATLDTQTICGSRPVSTLSQCNGFRSCAVAVSADVLGASGCAANTYKLARVSFECLEEDAFRITVRGTERVVTRRARAFASG